MVINRRIDHLNALLIDAAIAVRATYGDIAAVRLLRGRGFNNSVIVRVLSQPTMRRTAAYRPLHG